MNSIGMLYRIGLIKDCAGGIVLLVLKLTTNRYEASRGLSATAELLILYDGCYNFCLDCAVL